MLVGELIVLLLGAIGHAEALAELPHPILPAPLPVFGLHDECSVHLLLFVDLVLRRGHRPPTRRRDLSL
ncbi:MAG: hypothetical protein GY772_31665 [bacterium]|nr:hypothetical protein [bacterium]